MEKFSEMELTWSNVRHRIKLYNRFLRIYKFVLLKYAVALTLTLALYLYVLDLSVKIFCRPGCKTPFEGAFIF